MKKYYGNIVAGLIPLFTLGFVAHMIPYIYIPALPDIAVCAEFSLSDATSLMGAYSMMLSVTLLFVGAIGDRWNKKKLLTGGSAIIFTGAMLASIPAMYGTMHLGWALQGIGAAIITIVSQTWVAQVSTNDNITSHFSYMSIILSLAALLAPIIGGILTEACTWRFNFLTTGILIFIASIPLYRTTPPPPIPHRCDSVRRVLSGYIRIMFRSPFISLTGTSLVCFMFQGALMSYSSFLFIDRLGVAPAVYGLISVPVVAGSIAGQFPVMYLEKRYGLTAAYTFSSLIAGAALVASLLFYTLTGTHTVTELALVIFVFSIGFGGHTLLAIRNAMASFSDNRSQASALLNFANQFSGYLAVLSVQFASIFAGSLMIIHNIACIFTVVLIAATTLVYYYQSRTHMIFQ